MAKFEEILESDIHFSLNICSRKDLAPKGMFYKGTGEDDRILPLYWGEWVNVTYQSSYKQFKRTWQNKHDAMETEVPSEIKRLPLHKKKLSKCLLEEISRYNKYTFMHLKKTLKIRLNINFTSVEYWEKDRNISPDSESISEETKIRTKQKFEWQKK